jgi:azobenzene reductase
MKIAILAGSNRKEATSTKASHYIKTYLETKGHEVTLFDLYDSPIPLYCPDDEESDANLIRMKSVMDEADALVLSTPEYHGSVSGVLKNALDYLYEEVGGKVVLSVSSAGGAVGTSSLTHLQTIVRNVHGINSPEWISIGGENRKFKHNGEPENPKIKERMEKAADYFLFLAERLNHN